MKRETFLMYSAFSILLLVASCTSQHLYDDVIKAVLKEHARKDGIVLNITKPCEDKLFGLMSSMENAMSCKLFQFIYTCNSLFLIKANLK